MNVHHTPSDRELQEARLERLIHGVLREQPPLRAPQVLPPWPPTTTSSVSPGVTGILVWIVAPAPPVPP